MPIIAFKSDRYSSGFEKLLGHGCYSRAEMEEYCETFPGSFQIFEDDFDFGDLIPEDQRPKKQWLDKDGQPVELSPERRANILAVLEALTKPL